MALSSNKKALEEKEKGNKFFANKDYPTAIKHYTAAIEQDNKDYTFWSNRAASFLGINDFKSALDDAAHSITLKPDWSKGYYRQGLAYWGLGDIDSAFFALEKALQYDPSNQDIKAKVAEAAAERRKPKKVGLDGKPLPDWQIAKEEGNWHYKESRYEKAIEYYTKALNLASKSEDKAVIMANRAACYMTNTTQNYHEAIVDCTNALEINPNYTKALLRRGQAYEALEKYKLALQDMKQVLQLDPTNEVASQAAHRITTILKKFGN